MAEKVWKGPAQFRPFLHPVNDLEPWPGNPRDGNIAEIAASLKRFGQLKTVVADEGTNPDGWPRIVAGHHVVEAARLLGWTHVAVVSNDFDDEHEARAFLLADNRTGDLGRYDNDLLAAQLTAYAAVSTDWAGTGWDQEAYEERLTALRGDTDALAKRGQRTHRDPGLKDVTLTYTPDQLRDFENYVGIVQRELALGDVAVSEVVVQALRKVAAGLITGE